MFSRPSADHNHPVAGKRRKDGTFEDGTVNYRVDKQLKGMAEKLKEFPSAPTGKKKSES